MELGFTFYRVPKNTQEVQMTYIIYTRMGDKKGEGKVNQSRVVEVYPGDEVRITIADIVEDEK